MAYNYEFDEEMSEICTKLWEADGNRCEPGVDYEINLQGYVTSTRHMDRDWAREHLFSWVNEEEIFEKPTYKAFNALLDNYEAESSKPEEVTPEEEEENRHFLDLVVETVVMQEAHAYLVSQDRAPEDVDEFKELLYDVWFKVKRRLWDDNHLNSSGFEHVFVGETRGHQVMGFHNWIQFFLQEKRGNIDYRGFFRRGTSDEDSPRLICLQFLWKDGRGKPIGGSFIGCSPEFEMALYSLLFLMEKERILVNMAGYDVEMTCYRHGNCIGTAYPTGK